MKYKVLATRTYYSTIEFKVEADSYDEAEQEARRMIDDCQVEYDGIDNGYDDDLIEIYEVK